MTRKRDRNSLWVVLGSLGWPVLLGLAASTAFYAALHQGLLGTEFLPRYCAAHPILYCEVALFFVGLAALLLKVADLRGQLATTHTIGFDTSRSHPIPMEQCAEMLEELEELPTTARRSYLARRLREALEIVERTGTAEGLDEELKYLSELDEMRQQDSYGLVRIVIWATPMLGFLGTVVGITRALGDLDPKMLATAIEQAMQGLLAGLYVAFDTTSLALTLSMVLMFVQFFAERVETQLLAIVDLRANEELAGRFQVAGTSRDPQMASIQRMTREVIQTNEKLVTRQAEIWQGSIDVTNEKWSQSARLSADQIRSSLSEALEQALQGFAQQLAQTEAAAAEQVRQRWEQWQTALSNNARMMQSQQQEISRQSELMGRIVEATGDVMKLETSLNQNLQALAGSKNFEDTVMSLAAAIHLLNTRLGATDHETRRVDLGPSKLQGRAA
ncbi:MAG: MotA/TolQ/ExbB proton channel family protein [Pirellulaceae bacterium]